MLGTIAVLLLHTGLVSEMVPDRRPTRELSTWVGLGGGVFTTHNAHGFFAMRLGGDVTWSTCQASMAGCSGDSRYGTFVELSSTGASSLTTVGGVELFWGALPQALRMFYYTGEGTLQLRLGAGWVWRRELPGNASAPVASVTLAYGYRAPFSLKQYAEEYVDVQARRPGSRYMLGVRLWLNAQVDVAQSQAWQLTGGLEFEPVGALRFLTGIGY